MTQFTGAAAIPFFRPDARPTLRATSVTVAAMPGSSSSTARLSADTAVHERVSVPDQRNRRAQHRDPDRVAGERQADAADADGQRDARERDREQARVVELLARGRVAVAVEVDVDRPAVSAKLAPPVMKSNRLRPLSVPATVVWAPRSVTGIGAGVGSA